jgi:prepilin-type N-terminal cleavage/methylation domain-containing protein
MNISNKSSKHGVTLIEMMLVLALSTVLIVSFLQWQTAQFKDQRIDKFTNDISKIFISVQKRLTKDTADWNRWEQTHEEMYSLNGFVPWAGSFPIADIGTAPVFDNAGDTIIFDDNEAFVKGFLRNYLVGHLYPTARCGGWEAQRDPATLLYTETNTTAYVPCSLFQSGNSVIVPFEIKMSALLVGDTASGTFSDFALYIDMENDLTSKTKAGGVGGFTSGRRLMEYIDKHFKEEIIGTQFVELISSRGDLDDINDDVFFPSSPSVGCIRALTDANPATECYLRVRLDTTDATNDIYLRTDGSNDMLAAISFKTAASANSQQCVRWEEVGAAWNATLQDCGIWGGNDSLTVESVMDYNSSNKVFITGVDGGGVPIDYQCFYYTVADKNNDHYSNVGGTVTPCGLMEDGTVVQLVADDAFVGMIHAEDVIAQELRSSSIRVQYDPAYSANLLSLIDDAGVNIFSVNNVGDFVYGDPALLSDVLVNGAVTVTDGLTVSKDTFFGLNQNGELVQFSTQSTGGATQSISLGDQDIASPSFDSVKGTDISLGNAMGTRSYLGLNVTTGGIGEGFAIISDGDIYTSSTGDTIIDAEESVSIKALDGIYLEDDVLVTGTNRIYANTSSLRDSNVETLTGGGSFEALTAAQKQNFELATRDYVAHVENMQGGVSLRNVVLATGATITKPDCLDFLDEANNTASNPYFGTALLASKIAGVVTGESISRILLIPVWMKTYSYGFGDNQAYTHHAINVNATTWEVYNYLSGEGLTGTGAREDAAGQSLALLYCDYTGIDFKS